MARYHRPGTGLLLAVIFIVRTGFLVRLPWLDLVERLSDVVPHRVALIEIGSRSQVQPCFLVGHRRGYTCQHPGGGQGDCRLE